MNKFITGQAYSYIVYVLCNVVFYEIKFDIYVYYIYIYIHIYICKAYTYIYIYIYIHIFISYIYIYMYIYIYIYTYTHKHLLLNNWSISCTHIINDKHTLSQLMFNELFNVK